MATLIELKLQLQARSTALQTSLSGIQQQLSSIQDAKQLVAPVLQEFKDKKEGYYFIPEHMVQKISEHSRIEALQEEAATLSKNLQQIESGLNKLEDELKQEPAKKEVLDQLKHTLNVFMTPKDYTPPPDPDLDRLLELVAAEVDNRQFRTKFEALSLGEFISLKKEVVDKKDVYLVFLTDAGKALVENVRRDERLEKELNTLGLDIEQQEKNQGQLSERVTSFETDFVPKVHERARAAKASSKEIKKNIAMVVGLLKDGDNLQSQADRMLLEEANPDQDASSLENLKACAEKTRQALADLGDKAQTAYAEASRLLSEAKTACMQKQSEFGSARVWEKLQENIQQYETRLKQLLKYRDRGLELLPERIQKVDSFCIAKREAERIAVEEKRPENENKPVEQQLVESPVAAVQNDPVEQARYIQATDEYLQRLSGSIKEHLKSFEEQAKKTLPNKYLFIASNSLNVVKADVNSVSEALKTIYQSGDKTAKQKEMDDIFVREQQESLRDTLHKYRLMTQLKTAANISDQAFRDVLQTRESKDVLSKPRDSDFMIWLRKCGPTVVAIVNKLNAAYCTLFSPKGAKFAEKFARGAFVEDERQSLLHGRAG